MLALWDSSGAKTVSGFAHLSATSVLSRC